MSKGSQHNKKPGIKDVVKVTSSIIQELQIAQERINEEFKENDNKKDEPIDGADTDGDKENAGVRTERVRA